MIKIAICDDENRIVNQIEGIINKVCREEGIIANIDVFYSGELLEKEILMGTRYDLLYLDIQMKGEDGIDAARNIRKMDEDVMIIYVSGYDKYLMELFRLDVFSFIKKPIETDHFIKTFLDANSKICSKNIYFNYRYKTNEYKIPTKDIIYFDSSGRQITIHMKSGREEVYNGKLNDVENDLAGGKIPFLRTHQSYLVNYHLISSRSKTVVRLINEVEIPISEDRQKLFSREYGKLLGGEISG